MTETLTLSSEQKTHEAATGDLVQLALQSATTTAEQAGFALSEETEAELRTLFDVDPYAPVLPLSAHGLGCDSSNAGGTPHHAYLLPGYKVAAE